VKSTDDSLQKINEYLRSDPEILKKVEEFTNRYGTVTEKDLAKTFTL
jgi:hypothetical protein